MSRKGVEEGRKKIRHWYSYLRNDVLENFIFIIIHNSQGLINWCNFGFIVEKCRKMNGLFA